MTTFVDPFESQLTIQNVPPGIERSIRRGVKAVNNGQFAIALEHFRPVLRYDPNCLVALSYASIAHHFTHQFREAVACLRKVVKQEPNNHRAWLGIGHALLGSNDLAGSIEAHKHVGGRYRLNALAAIADARWQLGYQDDYVERVDEIAHMEALTPSAAYLRSFHLLRCGNYVDGWRDFEYRWQVEGFQAGEGKAFMADIPMWWGEKVDTLLVHQEQGFGDSIMMLRYLPKLRPYARRIIVYIDDVLVDLVASNYGFVDVVPYNALVPRADAQIPMMSFPHRFRTTPFTIPRSPYLAIDNVKERYPTPPYRIGVAWAGRPTHTDDKRRSMPFTALEPLRCIPNVELYSLQMGALGDGYDLPRLLNGPMSFAESARIVAALDGVVTVDTALAHLAGALNVPTYIMLAKGSEWRWGFGDRTPWYESVALARQSVAGDWAEPMQRVAAAIRWVLPAVDACG